MNAHLHLPPPQSEADLEAMERDDYDKFIEFDDDDVGVDVDVGKVRDYVNDYEDEYGGGYDVYEDRRRRRAQDMDLRDINHAQNLAHAWLSDPRNRLISGGEYDAMSDFERRDVKSLGFGVYIRGLMNEEACGIVMWNTVAALKRKDDSLIKSLYTSAFQRTILGYRDAKNAARRKAEKVAKFRSMNEGPIRRNRSDEDDDEKVECACTIS